MYRTVSLPPWPHKDPERKPSKSEERNRAEESGSVASRQPPARFRAKPFRPLGYRALTVITSKARNGVRFIGAIGKVVQDVTSDICHDATPLKTRSQR
jgi:hypothetical protein